MLTQGNVHIPSIPTKGRQISHFPIVFEQLKRDSSRLQKLMLTLAKNLIAAYMFVQVCAKSVMTACISCFPPYLCAVRWM